MHTFFAPTLPPAGGAVTLDEEEARHLKVRRLRPGEPLRLVDGQGGYAEASFEAGTTVMAAARKEEALPASEFVVLQALLPSEKLDWALQKAVEMGAGRILFYRAERSVAKREKADRWERLVRESCKQCGRARFPGVFAVDSLSEAVQQAGCETLWLCDGEGNRPVFGTPPASIGLIVGPEGGLTEPEKKSALASGASLVRFGPWTLRSETAAAAGLALLQYAYGSPRI